MHLPSLDEFRRHAAAADLVPVYRRMIGDSLTPVSACRRLDDGRCACLFESVVGGERVGRYSFLAAGDAQFIEARGRNVRVTETDGQATEFTCDDPLAELERRICAFGSAARLPELPPFCGGAVGYAGYDTVRYVERLPHAPPDDRRLPDMAFALFPRLVVFDNITKTLYAVALARVSDAKDEAALRRAYDAAQVQVDEMVTRLSDPLCDLQPVDIATGGEPHVACESNFSQPDFERAVERCLDYIRAGDIFQVVLSQRLKTHVACPPFEIYRTLRVVNPSPFMFYLRLPGVTLVGSSPEIMVRVMNGKITVRPLAGTRPRGRDEAEDRRLADELLADPKERAEHVMLVDLGRNDVGRVAQYRSVELSDVMTIERYSHVMHITSNVTGQLAAGRTAFDALRSCLPAGTVSGAPKVRAMQIIDELEPHRRGPYAGAVGYVDFSGNMDTCIALRTLVVQPAPDGRGSTAYIQVGAGIVADSVPAAEYQETLNKARGLLKAIEITERRVAATA